ncbi:MAG: alpha/beta hydrolase, partial [Acidimicrobiia bacterium]|nr:alpha/beta hydrolase [Acidimicrobiia bacterium]
RSDCALVSAGYRLSPEHPFPASLDDAHAAFHWMVGHADELGLDPSRVVIGGESAGGGLAASLVQRLIDEGTPIAGQLLVYPMLDDRTAARPDIGRKDHLAWNNASNRYGWSSFLGGPVGSATTPEYAVPARRADLSGLPPAWIGVGDLDLFLDEDTTYADRLRGAGVEVEFLLVQGAPHAFVTLEPSAPASTSFFDSAGAFARRLLHD